MGRIPKTILYRNVYRHPTSVTYPGLAIFRFEADLYFANISRFKRYVYDLIKSDLTIHTIIADTVSINYMDPTCLKILSNIIDDLNKKNINLVLVSAHAGIRETLNKGGITQKLKLSPKVHVHQAVSYFLRASRDPRDNSQNLINLMEHNDIVPLEDDNDKSNL